MATKIEGFIDGTWEGETFIPHKEGNRYLPFWEEQGISTGLGLWRPATIVLHNDKKAERVFTESEVRAMLEEISQKQYSYRESTDIVHMYEVEDVFAKHGITLDPA